MSATITAPAVPPAPVLVPRVKAYAGRQRVGFFIAVRVEGEIVWLVWRATEPSESDLNAIEVAARSGIAARGAWDITDVTKEALTFFSGAAPMVLTEALGVDTPSAAVAGTLTAFTGTYMGAEPSALDFWFDAGDRVSAPIPTIGSGKWSFETAAPAVGSHTLFVKVPYEDGVMGVSAPFDTTAAPIGATGASGATGANGVTAETDVFGASGATAATDAAGAPVTVAGG